MSFSLQRLAVAMLLKHVVASAWAMRVRLFAVGCIAAFGLSLFIGSFSAITSIMASRDHSYETGRLADIELRIEPDDVKNFPSFHDVSGVEAYTKRMVYPGSVKLSSATISILLISYTQAQTPSINTYQLIEGKSLDLADKNGVLVDRSLAAFHGVSVGQTLSVKLGKSQFDVHVRGIVEAPEFLLAPANPSLFIPSKGSLGVLYANTALLGDRFGFTPANSVLFRLKPTVKLEGVRTAITAKAESRLNVDWTMSRTEQFSYRFLNKDLGVFQIVLPLIVAASGLSTFFVTSFLFAQWILRERQTIGIFMALGYKAQKIAQAFAIAMASISASAILGGIAWSVIVMHVFATNFTTSIGLPLPQLALSPAYILTGVAGFILLFALSGAIALHYCLQLTPLDAMRASVTRIGPPNLLSSLLGKACKATWLRLALRNVLRTPGVSLMTVVSVALGFGVTAAFFISFSSLVGTSIASVQQNRWTLIADFVAPVWNEDLAKILKGVPGIRDYSPYVKGVAQAISGDQRINLYIGGFDPNKPWMAFTVLQGDGLSATDPQGILLEESAARELGLKIGDSLSIEAQGVRHLVHVRGMISGALPGETIAPIALERSIADVAGRSTGLLIVTDHAIDETARTLEAKADIAQVLSKDQVEQQILSASGHITDIIRIGGFFSMLIAVLFVFACVSYTVSRRKSEYQTLRMLGYSNRIIASIIVTEVCILGLLSSLLALPMSMIIAQEINRELSAAWFHIDTVFSLGDYFKGCLPGMLLLPVVALGIARGVLSEPLENFLRTREVA